MLLKPTKAYEKYYNNHKRSNSPTMGDPNPVIILWPGVSMFSFAKNTNLPNSR